jgi:pyrimidine deaminase RibD-like protein
MPIDPDVLKYVDALFQRRYQEVIIPAYRERLIVMRTKYPENPHAFFSGPDGQRLIRVEVEFAKEAVLARLECVAEAVKRAGCPFDDEFFRKVLEDVRHQIDRNKQNAIRNLSNSIAHRGRPDASAGFVEALQGEITTQMNRLVDGALASLKVMLLESALDSKAASRRPVESDDHRFGRMAVDEARNSVPEPHERPRPKVGVVVVKNGQVICKAHRGEVLGNHAEYLALEKNLAEAALTGATVYTTLEPCTTRNPPKIPCALRLAQRKVARVVVGIVDPDTRVSGKGLRLLRKANIAIDMFPSDLMAEVEEMNREFIRDCEEQRPTLEQHPSVIAQSRGLRDGDLRTSDDQTSAGRKWVEGLLARLLDERRVQLDCPIRWTADFGREIFTIEASLAGAPKIWRLSFEALEDCVEDRNVQRTIERSLRMYFVPDSEEPPSAACIESLSGGEVVEALKKHQKGVRLDQHTLHILDRDGYIVTSDVTNMQSSGRELLLISISQKGLALLARFQQ